MSTGIIYARVSTDDKEQDPARQIPDCERYADDHDIHVAEVVTEHYTGDSDPWSRPVLGEAIDKHNPRYIIFQELDRWSREHPSKVMRDFHTAENKGIKLVSATEPHFNMDSEIGDLMIMISSWFNRRYLEQLKKKTKDGIEQARREGKQIGRPEAEFNKHRAFHLLFNEGWSLQDVADEVGVSKSTVYRFKNGVEENPDSFKKDLGVS